MQFEYEFEGVYHLVEVSPAGLAVLQAFAVRIEDGLESVIVTLDGYKELNNPGCRAGAANLQVDGILRPVRNGPHASYQLTEKGMVFVATYRRQIVDGSAAKGSPLTSSISAMGRFTVTESGAWICTIERSDPGFHQVHELFKQGYCYFVRTEGPGHKFALTGRAAGFMEGVAWARAQQAEEQRHQFS